MHFSTTSSILAAAMLGVAQAQTPSGFKPSVKTKLDVMFNATSVTTAGELLAKAQVANQPQIAMSGNAVNSSGTYVFIMMDLDVPGQGKNTTRSVLLHCMNTGFKVSSQKVTGGATLLTASDKGPANYISPSPPSTDSTPHRYVELLYEQPASLNVKASDFTNSSARLNFDITSFATKNKLGEPIAANFFTVDGKATTGGSGGGAAASGTGRGGNGGGMASRSGSAGMPKSTTVPFTGAAVPKDVSFGLAGVLGGLVMAAL